MMININEMEIFLNPRLAQMGLKILKFSIWRSNKNIPNVDILIEKENLDSTNLGNCSSVHSIARLWLKNEGFGNKVNLTVRGPGIDRELFNLEDFKRFSSAKIKVTFKELLNERKKFEGFIKAIEDEIITLENCEEKISFNLENMEKANIVPDWKKILKESKVD